MCLYNSLMRPIIYSHQDMELNGFFEQNEGRNNNHLNKNIHPPHTHTQQSELTSRSLLICSEKMWQMPGKLFLEVSKPSGDAAKA